MRECGRCGAEFGESGTSRRFGRVNAIRAAWRLGGALVSSGGSVDLCPECVESLDNWLEAGEEDET
jgi:hypothetical protein